MVSVMLICVRNMELTYELHKAIKLNFINASNNAIVVLRVPSTLHGKHIRNCSEEMISRCRLRISILHKCWPCPVLASYNLAFVLQLRKKHGKTSVRVAEECW